MVRTLEFPLQGTQVQSLVEELRFHMLQGTAKKKKTKTNTLITEVITHKSQRLVAFQKCKLAHLRLSLTNVVYLLDKYLVVSSWVLVCRLCDIETSFLLSTASRRNDHDCKPRSGMVEWGGHGRGV